MTFYNNFGSILVLRMRNNQTKIMNIDERLENRIENFLQLVNQNMHNHYRTNFPSSYSETAEDHQYVVADTGRKFLRIATLIVMVIIVVFIVLLLLPMETPRAWVLIQ